MKICQTLKLTEQVKRMDVASLVSSIRKDLYDSYHIRWDVRVIETGEGDVNLTAMPSSIAGECVIGLNLYLFYTQLIMEMAVGNAPPIMSAIFRSIEKNGKDNLAQVEAFEKLFRILNGRLKYRINGDSYADRPLSELRNMRWSFFSLRYESGYLNIHNRLDFNYGEIQQRMLAFAGLILLFSSYQKTDGLAFYEEGRAYQETTTRYERNAINRELCLAHKGYRCSVCGIDMGEVYGEPGLRFIEVHHSIPVSEYDHERLIDPLRELYPVCPNCHAMLHRRKPPYTIEELKSIMQKAGKRGEEGK